MDRYNKTNGVDVAPVSPASADHPYYTSGDPQNDIPATTPGPWFYHMIIESLRNVIVAAGLVPDHDNLMLLTNAIQSFAGVKASSAEVLAGLDDAKFVTPAGLLAGLLRPGGGAANDYITLPYRDRVDGTRKNLIVQWGILTPPAGSASVNCDVTYSLAFPNAALIHLATIGTLTTDLDAVANYRNNTQSLQIGIPSLSGCEMQAYGMNNISDQRRIQYLAIGR